MQDNVNFKGHFKIQAIDANNNVVDEWEENNLIMENARETMAELFANLDTSTFINNVKLGTLGHVGDSIVTPKTQSEGFVKERDRLFSDAGATLVQINDTLGIIRKNDILNINAASPGYYRYFGEDISDYLITEVNIADANLWEFLGATAPYIYNVNFDLPGTNVAPSPGTSVINLTEDDVGAGSTVTVLKENSSVTFTISIHPNAANGQNGGPTSIFTEAALYANSRIFAMKTFKAKIKDSAILLRIIWTITF